MMKKLAIVFVVLTIMLAGCSAVPPYQSAVLDRIEAANDLSEVTNLLGAAMSHGVSLGPEASKEIKASLQDLYDAHRIATYALKMYRAQSGMFGYAELEIQMQKLSVASTQVVVTVRKWVSSNKAPPDDDVQALIEMIEEMTEGQKDKLLDNIGE